MPSFPVRMPRLYGNIHVIGPGGQVLGFGFKSQLEAARWFAAAYV